MNNRNKILKRNLDEAEEEIQKEKAQKRKAQRDMEDMLEAQEALNRELNSLKSKLRLVLICHVMTHSHTKRISSVSCLQVISNFSSSLFPTPEKCCFKDELI